MLLQSRRDLLLWERSSEDSIDVKRIYMAITDDIVAGVMLSQIVYWNLPSKDKWAGTKLRVKKENRYWLVKTREEWLEECFIKPRQVDRCLELLRNLGLVETKVFKFDGTPTLHIYLNLDRLIELINLKLNQYNAMAETAEEIEAEENGIKPTLPPTSPKGDIQITSAGYPLTENTYIDQKNLIVDSRSVQEAETAFPAKWIIEFYEKYTAGFPGKKDMETLLVIEKKFKPVIVDLAFKQVWEKTLTQKTRMQMEDILEHCEELLESHINSKASNKRILPDHQNANTPQLKTENNAINVQKNNSYGDDNLYHLPPEIAEAQRVLLRKREENNRCKQPGIRKMI